MLTFPSYLRRISYFCFVIVSANFSLSLSVFWCFCLIRLSNSLPISLFKRSSFFSSIFKNQSYTLTISNFHISAFIFIPFSWFVWVCFLAHFCKHSWVMCCIHLCSFCFILWCLRRWIFLGIFHNCWHVEFSLSIFFYVFCKFFNLYTVSRLLSFFIVSVFVLYFCCFVVRE